MTKPPPSFLTGEVGAELDALAAKHDGATTPAARAAIAGRLTVTDAIDLRFRLGAGVPFVRPHFVLDEVGRGTSTFDGMAIAQAILEELHDAERPGGAPKTIFATHYHELTTLTDALERLKTYRVDVLERGDDVYYNEDLGDTGPIATKVRVKAKSLGAE